LGAAVSFIRIFAWRDKTWKGIVKKNIVLCCDGTGNSFDKPLEQSNVAKVYSSLVVDATQVCYYHPGVGTMGSPNSRGRIDKEWSRIKGLAFGAGLLTNVGDAYRFLMDTYADGDDIFLFGFSRGAFTVRALASLLHVFGLLCRGNHDIIPYVLNMYAKRSREAKHKHRTFPSDEPFKWQFSHSRPVRISFCGLWDTVSSYGWIYDPVQLPFLGCNPIIEIGRHAISIDERRCFYQDNLWGKGEGGQDIRQVWFNGVHSDVGGSYVEDSSGLSKIALEWMIVEAIKAGLQVEPIKAKTILGKCCPYPSVTNLPSYIPPNCNGMLHESLKSLWWLLEVLPQQDPHLNGKRWCLPLGRRRTIPINSRVHQSVVSSKSKPQRLPPHSIEPWIVF
jgi:uncharacterized protein (DUF2235 family)